MRLNYNTILSINQPSFTENWQLPFSFSVTYRMLCVPNPWPALLLCGIPSVMTGFSAKVFLREISSLPSSIRK